MGYLEDKKSFEELFCDIFSTDDGFDRLTVSKICQGIISQNFTDEQLDLLVDHLYDYKQIEQLILGLEHGLSMEQMELIANPLFDNEQMAEIRIGFEMDIPIELVEFYARTEYSANQMYGARRVLTEILDDNLLREKLGPNYKKRQPIYDSFDFGISTYKVEPNIYGI